MSKLFAMNILSELLAFAEQQDASNKTGADDEVRSKKQEEEEEEERTLPRK